MAAIHFFTETAKLQAQSAGDAYGPVDGNETTQYRVTQKGFLSADANAYAITQGKIFLQPHSNGSLVNLVLVPVFIGDLENGFTPVKYFIYRGLKKSNFFTGPNDDLLSENDANASDFVNHIWQRFNQLKNNYPNITVTTPSNKSVGWQYAVNPSSTPLEEIFHTEDPDHENITAPKGIQLGIFDKDYGGLEIVLFERMYLPDLNNIRAAETVITASAPGGNDIPGNEPIANMRKREDILNYVDPVAWYMLFHEKGIDYDVSQTVTGYSDIFESLLIDFYTSNILYVDIRNENSYSLNYYKDNEGLTTDSDYGKHILLSWDGGPLTFTDTIYYDFYWPILSTLPLLPILVRISIPCTLSSERLTIRNH